VNKRAVTDRAFVSTTWVNPGRDIIDAHGAHPSQCLGLSSKCRHCFSVSDAPVSQQVSAAAPVYQPVDTAINNRVIFEADDHDAAEG
jgi:hypothetical protein